MEQAEQRDRRTENGRERGNGRRGTGRRNEIATGVALVVAVLAVFFGVRYMEDRPIFQGTYALTAEFERAGGVLPGSAVTVSGVQVGEVKNVSLLPQGHRVRLRLQIRDGIDIPEGSVARIQGFAALDNVSVAIVPGPEDRPPLADGASIPSEGSTPMIERVDSTLAGAQGTFGVAESLLTGTERDLDVILTNMRSASGEAASLLRSERSRLHNTIVDLRSTSAQLDALAAKLDHAAERGGDSLAVAIDQLNHVMRRLDVSVASIERSSSSIENVMAHVESGRGTLGRMVYDESLYTRLDSAARHLERILAEFNENPGRYLQELELVDIF